jgi:hypothetical protein
MLIGVTKRTGQGREEFAESFVQGKLTSTQVLKNCPVEDMGEFLRRCLEVIETLPRSSGSAPFRILYSVMWGKAVDMVVVTIFGAPPNTWEEVVPIANVMAQFTLIGPKFSR